MGLKVQYWFTSLGNASSPTAIPWDPDRVSNNSSVVGLETEGFWYLWKTMLERKMLDEVEVIIESAKSPGIRRWAPNYYCRIVPHIDNALQYIRPGDVIFARGGFRSWFVRLVEFNQQKRWVLFYRAATHRLKWPVWDVVVEDLTDKHFVQGDRLHYRFNKPLHPDMFQFDSTVPRIYDVMLHAAHIHDKKAQWKGIDAAIAYKRRYGKNLAVVMPGGWYGGGETRMIPEKIQRNGLDVFAPGMIPRKNLCKLMNKTKLYLHLGGAGQNDRGNLESMCCGVQQIVGNPQFHDPIVYTNQDSVVLKDHSPDNVARILHEMLEVWQPKVSTRIALEYQRVNGLEVAVSQMDKLFKFIEAHPTPDRKAVIDEFRHEEL